MERNMGSIAGAGQINRTAPPVVVAPGPSLEDRHEHLQRAVERLCRLRGSVEAIAERLNGITNEPSGGIAPSPPDLSGRFGETIGHVHNNLDQLEYLVERIYGAMFNTAANCASPGRG